MGFCICWYTLSRYDTVNVLVAGVLYVGTAVASLMTAKAVAKLASCIVKKYV